jgi:hypothetical protein
MRTRPGILPGPFFFGVVSGLFFFAESDTVEERRFSAASKHSPPMRALALVDGFTGAATEDDHRG